MASNQTPLTITGQLTDDPQLRYTPSGTAVANFTIASTPRTFDRKSGEWKDEETIFIKGTVWRDQAVNVAETLSRGSRVIVEGLLKSRSYETKDGEKRTELVLEVEEVGASLKYASGKITRNPRGGGGKADTWTGQPRPTTKSEAEWIAEKQVDVARNGIPSQEPAGFWGDGN